MTPSGIVLVTWLLGSVATALLFGRVLGRADATAPATFTGPDHIPADVVESVDLPRMR